MILNLVRAGLRATAAVSPGLAGRFAFELWRRPLMRGKVREPEREIHEAARVEVVDGIVAYAWGDGSRPVLLVHGWRSRASRYYAFVARLVELGYSPVSYDAPGHGDTPGPTGTILDHQRIIRSLEARHGTFEGVIAYSIGVPFALYAVREGVAARWIVTISGLAEFGYLVDTFCKELGLGQEVNLALRRTIERRLFQGDREIWTKYSVGVGGIDLLAVHNDEDDVVDPAQAELLLAQYGPKARLLRTTGLGHHRIVSDPDVIHQTTTFLTAARPTSLPVASEEPWGLPSGSSDAGASDVAEGVDLGAQ